MALSGYTLITRVHYAGDITLTFPRFSVFLFTRRKGSTEDEEVFKNEEEIEAITGRMDGRGVFWLTRFAFVSEVIITFTYFGSSNLFCFLLHNEILWRNCFVQSMCYTSTFWKCVCMVWEYGECNKSYERESKKCHLKVLSIFPFGMVEWPVRGIAADFYP